MKSYLRIIYPFLLGVWLIVLGLGDAAARKGITTLPDRSHLHEEDFKRAPRLHASERQTVVLELEAADRGRRGNRAINRFRLFLEQRRKVSFCIPEDDPHLAYIKVRNAKGRMVYGSWRGSHCRTRTLRPGRYEVIVAHRTRDLPVEGKLAFFHLPEPPQLLGSGLDGAASSLSFMAFRGPNDLLVTTNGDGDVIASGTNVDLATVWRIDGVNWTDGNGNAMNILTPSFDCPQGLYIGERAIINEGTNIDCFTSQADLPMTLVGELQFRLTNTTENVNDPIIAGSDGSLAAWEFGGETGSLMTTEYRGFACEGGQCDSNALTLQQGEVALFSQCDFTGPAIVFAANVADFARYDGILGTDLGIADDTAASVRVGPNTLVQLYPDSQFGGTPFITSADTPCLDDTPLGSGALSSMRLQSPRDYIVATDTCLNCNLAGIDLSGLDLTAADFTGTDLDNADLTGTIFTDGVLENANLSKARLIDADLERTNLRCTDLSGVDLTQTGFDIRSAERGFGPDFMAPTAGAIVGGNGFLVSDPNVPALFRVDQLTGDRTYIAAAGIGSGTTLANPFGVAALGDDLAYVDTTAADVPFIARLDPASGVRSVVSGPDVGSGDALQNPAGLVASVQSPALYVSDSDVAQKLRIDTASGDRSIVSSNSVGSGTQYQAPTAIQETADGNLLVVNATRLQLLQVDPGTGDRVLVSGPRTGSGPNIYVDTLNFAIDSDGTAILPSSGPGLIRIDLATGERTPVTSPSLGSGPSFQTPTGVSMAADGSLLVTDFTAMAVFQVDPATGDRVVLSGLGTSDVTTDLSCRLNLAGATFDQSVLPPELWRFTDLTNAAIDGVQGATLSTSDNPIDFSGARLSGVNLKGVMLDGADLGCATQAAGETVCSELQSTNLADASLKAVELSYAQLQGASLSGANLEGADLSHATLRGLAGGSPATLSRAFMRGASLANADLTGVVADHLNFYSIAGAKADATSAVMTGAKFTNAYMAGADFNGATLQSTEWTNAVLAGANFTGANLSKNADSDEVTDFSGAYLQGAVFGGKADVSNVNFNSSYWDLAPTDPTNLNILLPPANLSFSGYWGNSGNATCVQATYPNDDYPTPVTPTTGASNTCPDGSVTQSGCDGYWEQPSIPIDQATPPSAVDPELPGTCTTTDFCWLIESPFCVP